MKTEQSSDNVQQEIGSVVERVKAFFGGKISYRVIVILGLCGIALIGVSNVFSHKSTEQSRDVIEQNTTAYVKALEERLETMVSSIQGAGMANVMVTLENGVEYVYASEEKLMSDHSQNDTGQISASDDSQRTVVTVDADSGKQGLLVTQIEPTVRGVVVACEGASNETVLQMVKQAVKTALNITDKRVCVIPYSVTKESLS